MDLHILPECYVDTNLVETITKSRFNHKKGCNNVVKAMLEANHLKDGFAFHMRKPLTYIGLYGLFQIDLFQENNV